MFITERNKREAYLKVSVSALWFLAKWWREVFREATCGMKKRLVSLHEQRIFL